MFDFFYIIAYLFRSLLAITGFALIAVTLPRKSTKQGLAPEFII